MKNERRLNFQETVKKEILIELSIHASSFCVKCTTIKFHSFFLVRRFIQTISFLSIAKASKEIIQEIGEKSSEERD